MLLTLVVSAASGSAAERVALVIGNGAYRHAAPLENPRRDAEAVEAVLKEIGFEVISGVDLDRAGMGRVAQRFGRAAGGAEIALIFYAGHGVQVGGRNWLVPVDATLEREPALAWEAVRAAQLLDEAVAARRLRLLVLDACRDNPFSQRIARSLGASRSADVGRGLARIEEIASDTMIAFATRAGEIAEEGDGPHSPYTEALLAHVKTPGLTIERLFGKVRDSVRAGTGGKQEPFTYGSLGGDPIYLVPPEPEPEPTPPTPLPDPELIFWSSIQDSEIAGDFAAYLDQFSDGTFAALARNRLAALTPSPPEPVPEPEPDAVRRQAALAKVDQIPATVIQYALQGLGLYGGAIDGILGSGSAAGIRRFQGRRGAAQTGRLTPAETVALITAAADAGHVQSETALGVLFAMGVGVVQDGAAAVSWLKRAAARGDPDALYNLGILYQRGVGVSADQNEAAKLFGRAAAAGHADAAAALSALRG